MKERLAYNQIFSTDYYEIIKFADVFLVLDDVQYTKRDWRNKNYINFT